MDTVDKGILLVAGGCTVGAIYMLGKINGYDEGRKRGMILGYLQGCIDTVKTIDKTQKSE